VLPDGTLAPGWTANGVQVSGTSLRPGGDFLARLAPDGSGGVYLAWEWQTGATRGMAQHLAADGSVAPGWLPGGIELSPGTNGHFTPQVVSDSKGGAIIVWEWRTGGGFLVAQRYQQDGPVPVQVSLASVEAMPDRVVLLWQGPGLGSVAARVERRTESSDWSSLGAAAADGADRLRFEDHFVAAGERYAYRLAYVEEGVERTTSETWVEVPHAFELALEGFRPNPLVGAAVVAFTLPDGRSARLEVIDVAGRRVLARDVGALGPGRHTLRLNEGPRLAPGVFLLRLTTADRVLLTRGVVIR
jgi:hypothetical protein